MINIVKEIGIITVASNDIANAFNNYFASVAETSKKKKKKIHLDIFQIIFLMKTITQYFCNLLIKRKWPTSYPILILIKLLAQIVYLIEYYFF